MDPRGGEGNIKTKDEFKKAFYDLRMMVEELYKVRMEKNMIGSSRKDDKEKGKGIGFGDNPHGGDGDGPLESPLSPSSPSSHNSSSSSEPSQKPSLPLALTSSFFEIGF